MIGPGRELVKGAVDLNCSLFVNGQASRESPLGIDNCTDGSYNKNTNTHQGYIEVIRCKQKKERRLFPG